MTQNTTASSGGVGFLGLLTLIFITLKLVGPLAHWSWWMVFAPIWIPFLIFVAVLLVLLLIALIVKLIDR